MLIQNYKSVSPLLCLAYSKQISRVGQTACVLEANQLDYPGRSLHSMLLLLPLFCIREYQ